MHARPRRILGALLAVIVAVTVFTAEGAGAAEVIGGDAPDPHIIADGDAYYAYTTNTIHYFHTTNVPVYRSTDLHNWTLAADALPQLGAWATPGYTWAPGAIRLNGAGYVLYYTARHTSSGLQCVGVAVSASPTGPFVDHNGAPIVCQVERGGSIDAFPMYHQNSLYLLWKSDDNAFGRQTHLWGAQLTADGRGLASGAHHLLAGDRAWEQPLIENPAMISNQAGAYTLFYSANWWESPNYAVGYATCAGPLGPCTKNTVAGPFMSSGPGTVGPGGQAVFTDHAGNPQIVYHAWQNGVVGYFWGGGRSMHVDQLIFNGGVPSLRNSPANRIVGVAEAAGGGFWTTSASGAVSAHSGAPHRGDMSAVALARPVISMASTPTGDGYWLVAGDGGIFSFGDAAFYGSTGAMHLNRPIVGMAATPSGRGYWLVAADGGIFSFGDAAFYGSTGAMHLNRPIVGMAATPSGRGYWLVASDGGIFTFGDGAFRGSAPGRGMAVDVSGVVANRAGGYTIVATNGGIHPFN